MKRPALGRTLGGLRPTPSTTRYDLSFGLGAAVLVALVGLTFGKALHFAGPILDDDHAVALNPHIGSLAPASLRWIVFPDFAHNARFMPLGWLGVDLETRLTGLNPFRMHGFVLALHAVNSVLLAAVLRRFLLRAGATGGWGGVAAPLAGAAFYALHPMRAETLGWVSLGFWHQSVFFALVWAWIRLGVRWRPWAEAAAFLGCLLSFPVFLGLAPAAAAAEWGLLGWRAALRRNLALLVLTGACAAMTLYATTVTGPVPQPVPFGDQAVQLLAVEGHFVIRSLVPSHLSPFTKPVHDLLRRSPAEIAGCLAFAALWVGALLPRGRPLLPWIAAFTLLGAPFAWTSRWHDPDIGNRYATGGHLLLAAAVAYGLWRLPAPRWVGVALVAVGVGTWMVLGAARIGAWEDDLTLEADTRRNLPQDDLTYRASVAVVQGEAAICRYLSGDYPGALGEIDAALRFAPGNPDFTATRAKIEGMRQFVASPPAPGSPPVAIPRVMEHWSIAAAALRDGDNTKAQIHLGEVERLDPVFYRRIISP